MHAIQDQVAAAQERAQVVLVDRCTVRRDPEGTRDDTLDDGSLSYDDAPDDAATVGTDVPCKVNHDLRNYEVGEAGQPTVQSSYRVSFAHDFDVRNGDEVTVDQCRLDPSMVGQRLTIIEVIHGSFRPLKRCRAEMVTEGVDLP